MFVSGSCTIFFLFFFATLPGWLQADNPSYQIHGCYLLPGSHQWDPIVRVQVASLFFFQSKKLPAFQKKIGRIFVVVASLRKEKCVCGGAVEFSLSFL